MEEHQRIPPEIRSTFKRMADEHVSSYGNYPGHVEKFGMPKRGVWRREWFAPEHDHLVTFELNNTRISPYIGIVIFTVRRHLTNKHSTQEQADRDYESKLTEFHKHKHFFIYRDNQWVPTPRVNKWRNRASSWLEWIIFIIIVAAVGIPVALLLNALNLRTRRLPILVGAICGAYAAYCFDKLILQKIRGDQCEQYYPYYKSNEFRSLKERGRGSTIP